MGLPGSPISLARFIRHASGCGLDWERCVSAPEGLQPTEGVEGPGMSDFGVQEECKFSFCFLFGG